jgi:hypothetical protein
MSLQQAIAKSYASSEVNARAHEFAHLVKFILSQGTIEKAAYIVEKEGSKVGLLGPRLADIILTGALGAISRETITKAATGPVGLTGSPLFDYSAISTGFVNSLVNASAFDTMLASMVPLPFATGTVGAVSVGARAFSVSEASVKPITSLTINNQLLTPLKAHALLVITQELARMGFSGSVQLIQRELQNAVGVLTDAAFIVAITAGLSAFTSTGSTAEAVRADIAALLRLITTGQGSKLFILTTAAICKNWSMLTDSKGLSAFEDLTPTGGQIQGIVVIPTDGVISGQVVLADATGLGGNAGEVLLQNANEVSLQMESLTPDSPPSGSTNLLSVWQMNENAIRVERYFNAVKLRSDAVAICNNANSYASGNSPP